MVSRRVDLTYTLILKYLQSSREDEIYYLLKLAKLNNIDEELINTLEIALNRLERLKMSQAEFRDYDYDLSEEEIRLISLISKLEATLFKELSKRIKISKAIVDRFL